MLLYYYLGNYNKNINYIHNLLTTINLGADVLNTHIMNKKTEHLIDLIFKKLKDYSPKKISLERENLKQFVSFLFEEK